jgi:hypothetical protein
MSSCLWCGRPIDDSHDCDRPRDAARYMRGLLATLSDKRDRKAQADRDYYQRFREIDQQSRETTT